MSSSIFDVIEEGKENPEEFRWLKCSSLLEYEEAEKLHEGALNTIKDFATIKENKYVLTSKCLIKYNVNTALTVDRRYRRAH